MKKRERLFLMFAAGAGLLAAVNYGLFARAKSAKSRRSVSPREAFWDSRFGRVHFTVRGKGEPLLLIHGIGAGRSSQEWDAVSGLLAKDYKVYAVDLLGFGLSDAPSLSYSAYLYVSLINQFVQKVIRKKTVVIAEGLSAAYAAMACTLAPERFVKLLLVAPEGVDGFPGRPFMQSRLVKFFLETPLLGTAAYNALTSRVKLRGCLREQLEKPRPAAELLENRYLMSHMGGAGARFVMSAQLSGFLDADIRKALSQIKTPIRVLWGQNNRQNPVSQLADIRRLHPAVETVVIKNTGALPYWEKPRAFCKACGLKSIYS